MDGMQRLIVGLLILSILFSVFSIMISYSASNIDIPYKKVSGNAVDNNDLSLDFYVEANNPAPSGGSG